MQGGADVFGAIFTPNIPSQISNPRNVLDLEKKVNKTDDIPRKDWAKLLFDFYVELLLNQ